MKLKLTKLNRQLSVVRCRSYPGRSTLEFILDWCSLASLSGTLRSTGVENIRQISLFLQNKPNFPHFSTENEDYDKKQTQSNPIQSQKQILS
jgi:hypothetical protein